MKTTELALLINKNLKTLSNLGFDLIISGPATSGDKNIDSLVPPKERLGDLNSLLAYVNIFLASDKNKETEVGIIVSPFSTSILYSAELFKKIAQF